MLRRIKQKLARVFGNGKNNEWVGINNLDTDLLDLYRQFIKPGQLCFDIGANIGTRTDLWLQLGARVICVEPQPDCIIVLRSKYMDNPNVELVEAGLDSKPGVMTLSVCKSANTLSTFSDKWKTGRFKDYAWDAQYKVKMITLDELIRKFGIPEFCKIDVEGFELEVIQGLSTPIRALSFEFTIEFLSDAQKCAEHLEAIGDVEFNFALGDNLNPSLRFGLEYWVDSRLLIKEIKHLTSSSLWGDVYARFVE